MDKTIKVTGKGSLKVKPNYTKLTFTLSNTKETYEEALEEVNTNSSYLKDIFVNFGFHRTDLKTSSFSIEQKYETYHDEDGSYKKRFAGYNYYEVLFVRFLSDTKLLNDILNEIVKSKLDPEVDISYLALNDQKTKAKVLDLAIKSAKTQAKNIAKFAGITLGDIISIEHYESDYGSDSYTKSLSLEDKMAGKQSDALKSLEIEPEDITIRDSVEVIYQIK